MTLNEYQESALRTASGPYIEKSQLGLAACALGVAGEAGEVADLIKKHVAQGRELVRSDVIEELGDVLWYVAVTASNLGIQLESVAAFNNNKLADRYPDGFKPQNKPPAPPEREDEWPYGK